MYTFVRWLPPPSAHAMQLSPKLYVERHRSIRDLWVVRRNGSDTALAETWSRFDAEEIARKIAEREGAEVIVPGPD